MTRAFERLVCGPLYRLRLYRNIYVRSEIPPPPRGRVVDRNSPIASHMWFGNNHNCETINVFVSLGLNVLRI